MILPDLSQLTKLNRFVSNNSHSIHLTIISKMINAEFERESRTDWTPHVNQSVPNCRENMRWQINLLTCKVPDITVCIE